MANKKEKPRRKIVVVVVETAELVMEGKRPCGLVEVRRREAKGKR